MHNRLHTSVPTLTAFSKVKLYQKNPVFQKQPNKPNNYSFYLSTMSLSALQKQLQAVRDKEKQFYKLNYQLSILEKRSRRANDESRKITSDPDNEDEEIAQLKAEIEGVNTDIKNITEEAKIVKRQCIDSKAQLTALQEDLERAKGQNKKTLEKVEQKRTKLMQKSSVIEHLKQFQLENHKKVNTLRQEIKSLEQQSHLLQSELNILTEQKQTKQKNRQKLLKILSELQRQLLQQKDQEHQNHFKLSHFNNIKQDLEQQLIALRKLEQNQILNYEAKLQQYHHACCLVNQSSMNKKSLQDEFLVVQNDLQELNLQFIAEGELLKKQQQQNQAVNHEFDIITKEAINVWNSICELIKLQETQNNTSENSKLPTLSTEKATVQTNFHQDIKFKALKVWKQIQKIIQVDGE